MLNNLGAIDHMSGYVDRMAQSRGASDRRYELGIPVIFIQDAHEASLRAMDYLQFGARAGLDWALHDVVSGECGVSGGVNVQALEPLQLIF